MTIIPCSFFFSDRPVAFPAGGSTLVSSDCQPDKITYEKVGVYPPPMLTFLLILSIFNLIFRNQPLEYDFPVANYFLYPHQHPTSS